MPISSIYHGCCEDISQGCFISCCKQPFDLLGSVIIEPSVINPVISYLYK